MESLIPGTEKQFLAAQSLGILDIRPMLDVKKLAPGLGVPCKTLHERGITILASMRTAYVWIHRRFSIYLSVIAAKVAISRDKSLFYNSTYAIS